MSANNNSDDYNDDNDNKNINNKRFNNNKILPLQLIPILKLISLILKIKKIMIIPGRRPNKL